ncbi:hypothetical protein D3C86_1628040 [compost metagenome]
MNQSAADAGVDLVAMGPTVGLVVEIGEEGLLDQAAQGLQRSHGDGDIAVAGGEDAVGRADIAVGVGLGRARLRLAADSEDRHLLHLDGGDGVQHVDLDQLTLARPLAVEQGRQRPLEGGVGGNGVDQILARRRRRLIRRSRRHHRP